MSSELFLISHDILRLKLLQITHSLLLKICYFVKFFLVR